MEQAIEKQEEQKPTRRKKEKKGMPMLLQLGGPCGVPGQWPNERI